MSTLTIPQDRALRLIDANGEYTANSVGNYYHLRHQPGLLYIDGRTADVLVRLGFAERKYGRLFRTEAGRAYAKATPRPKR